jgi:DNA-binding CsgD family transcriptional regulator
MAMNMDDAVSLNAVIDQIYRDFCKIRPDSTAMKMFRTGVDAATAGLQAAPLGSSFRYEYLVHSGFDARPQVDNRIRSLSREIAGKMGETFPLPTEAAIRVLDFEACLPAEGPGGELRSYFAHIGLRHAMLSPCLIIHDWRYVLFVARSPGQPAFGDRELAWMEALIPHFRSALRARTRLVVSQRLAESCGAGLDRLGIGVIVIDACGQLVEVSPIAEGILAAKDGLLSSPRLAASCNADNRRLQALLRRAGSSDWKRGGTALSIERPSGQPNYQLVIDALPQPPGVPSDGSVVLYLRDRTMGPANALEAGLLQDLFGLTEAEALVARAAADGRSAHEIARDLGIRYNTVRAHFRSIFAKSGFSSRADLVHMVVNSPASLGRPGQGAGEVQAHAISA